ncbi:DUF4238 domain-containing protein [Singulisphaera rosea]
MADNPNQKTKNQHWVPQCYLRRFADEQGGFFSFNKLYQKSRPANIKSSASADYFYDFEPSTLHNPTDEVQWVETTFSLLEKRFKEILDAFLAEASRGQVTPDTGMSMAHFVAIQLMRTRGHRDTMLELNAKVMQDFVNRWYAENHPGMPPGKFTMGKGYAEAFHAQSMFEDDSIFIFAEKLSNLLWIVGHNATDKPFYTSDEPVVRRIHPIENRTTRPLPPGVGLEYAYPLNSEFILMMLDRRGLSDELVKLERRTVEFPPEAVEQYNSMQVVSSTQYVFCEKQDFELAERVCREHPEICNPNRPRTE